MKPLKLLSLGFVSGFFLIACQKDENQARPISTISRLYVSNSDVDASVTNTSVFDRADRDTLPNPYNFDSKLPDAGGIYFDVSTGTVYQISRRAKNVKMFKVNTDGSLQDRGSFLDESLGSARQIALDRAANTLYITSNLDSAIYVYEKVSSLSGTVTATKKLKLNGQPWGIHFENNQLLVVIDQPERREVQVFDNPSNLVVGIITPNQRISVNGAVRLHGITYSSARDVIILTDVGISQGSDPDGAIHIIEGAKAKFTSGGTVSPDRTIRGANTFLGNPADVAWDTRGEVDRIYISEKVGSRLLIFKYADNANTSPVINKTLSASPESLFLDVR